MNKHEHPALIVADSALIGMMYQYLTDHVNGDLGDPTFKHKNMVAGKAAIEYMYHRGYLDSPGSKARLTAKGRALADIHGVKEAEHEVD